MYGGIRAADEARNYTNVTSRVESNTESLDTMHTLKHPVAGTDDRKEVVQRRGKHDL